MKNDRGDESTAITGLRPTRGNGWVPRDLFTRRDDSSGESELGETLFSFRLVGLYVRPIGLIMLILLFVRNNARALFSETNRKKVENETLKKKSCNIEDFFLKIENRFGEI